MRCKLPWQPRFIFNLGSAQEEFFQITDPPLDERSERIYLWFLHEFTRRSSFYMEKKKGWKMFLVLHKGCFNVKTVNVCILMRGKKRNEWSFSFAGVSEVPSLITCHRFYGNNEISEISAADICLIRWYVFSFFKYLQCAVQKYWHTG